jgi:Trypsin
VSDKFTVDFLSQIIISHPQYRINQKYHDISLVKLMHSVQFSETVWPACLVPDVKVKTDTELLIAGFGRTDIFNCK